MRLRWPWYNDDDNLKRCLFCLRTPPQALPENGMAGINGFICKECIALCTHSVASRDSEWLNKQIEVLIEIQNKNAHSL
jgi:hypothetical protein